MLRSTKSTSFYRDTIFSLLTKCLHGPDLAGGP